MSEGGNKAAVAVLIFGTVVFAINAFDLFSTFFLIAEEFHGDVSMLGIISASMVIGIGIAQIPAGILAAKHSPRIAAVVGMIIICATSALMALSTDFFQIAVQRGIMGGGLALFFPSAIVLGAQYLRKGSEGLGAGIIVGANAAGGLLGLVLWAIIAGILGWRTGIILGAALAAVAAIAMFFVLPRMASTNAREFAIKASHIRAFITDKYLIIIGITLLGSQAAFEQVLAFMPFYLQQVLTVEPATAGLVASFALMSALAGSPITGWLYDRKRRIPLLILMLGVGIFIGISLNYLQTIGAAILSSVVVGFAGGGLFTLLTSISRERVATGQKEHHRVEYITLSVNWVHAIALTGTFWAPILFSTSALQYGYAYAWPLLGIISVSIMTGALVIILGILRKEEGISFTLSRDRKQ
jgi:MFS family permease